MKTTAIVNQLINLKDWLSLHRFPGCRGAISALRDGIRIIEQYEEREARVLTADQIRKLPRLAIVWTEYWDGEEQKADLTLLAAMKCIDGTLVDEDGCSYSDFENDMSPTPNGSRWRFWDGKPTAQQRKEVPWI